MLEVECRIKLSKEEFEKTRKNMAKKIEKELEQTDIYYHPPHKYFATTSKGREFLRIRNSNQNHELTYKHAKYDKNNKLERMLEQNIIVDNGPALKEILETIGFRQYLTITKKRSLIQIPNFEICLDEIKDLGHFIEIEYTGKIADYKKAYQKCLEQIKTLNINNPEICETGYVQMMEEKKTTNTMRKGRK